MKSEATPMVTVTPETARAVVLMLYLIATVMKARGNSGNAPGHNK